MSIIRNFFSFICTLMLSTSALATNVTYCVIDVSGGTSAKTFPVTYLENEPTSGWQDEYKMTKIVLRYVSPGTFMMGSELNEVGRLANESRHQVTITDGFWIGVYEVTQRQFELVTGQTPSYYSASMRPCEMAKYEVVRGNCSNDTFIGIMRTKTGISGFDLPTEAQWEFACRAGTTNAFNNGKSMTAAMETNIIDDVACTVYNHSTGPKVVGSYEPNDLGLYDMHGNVMEWCRDGYVTNLGTNSVTDPVATVATNAYGYVSVRGGSWKNRPEQCRSAARERWAKHYGSDTLGFRLYCDGGLISNK